MIFDAHTHWSGGPPSDPLDPSDWLSAWDQNGVTHGVLCPLAGLLRDDQVAADNDHVAAACERSGGRLLPFCTVQPNTGDEAVAELRRCLGTRKVRGLKLHPWLQGFSPSGPEVDRLCEMAGQAGASVLFHDGTPCYSLPSQIALLARRHPRTTFVLAHCGLFEHWREAIEAMRYSENLWGCLCSPHPAALREIVRRADLGRLLWGSDHGFGPRARVGYHLHTLDQARLTDAQRSAILAENPQRLFGLAAPQSKTGRTTPTSERPTTSKPSQSSAAS